MEYDYASGKDAYRFFSSIPSCFMKGGKINIDCIRYHIIRCMVLLRCYEVEVDYSRKNNPSNVQQVFYTVVSEAAKNYLLPLSQSRQMLRYFLRDNFTYRSDGSSGDKNDDWMPLYLTIVLESMSGEQKLSIIDEAQNNASKYEVYKSSSSVCKASLMHVAAGSVSADIDLIKVLASPAAARSKDTKGRVPLHWVALYSTSLPMLEYLLEEWPEATSIRDDDGYTPLYLLIKRPVFPDKTVMIMRLIDANPASCGLETYDLYQTALHLFCRHVGTNYINQGGDALRVMDQLIAACPSAVSRADVYEKLPLHCLCMGKFFEEKLSLVKTLILKNSDAISVMDSVGHLPAHCAVSNERCMGTLPFLLDLYPEALSKESNTRVNMLSLAATFSEDIFRYLLQRKPELASFAGIQGELPLHSAVISNEGVDHVKVLYAAYPDGAKAFLVNGCLPIHFALRFFYTKAFTHDKAEIVRFLLRQCPETANMRKRRIREGEEDDEEEDNDDDDGIGGEDDDGIREYELDFDMNNDSNACLGMTPYQLSRRNAVKSIQRLFLIACPEIDPERLRKLTYEARRPLMFLAFAARTNAKAALRLSTTTAIAAFTIGDSAIVSGIEVGGSGSSSSSSNSRSGSSSISISASYSRRSCSNNSDVSSRYAAPGIFIYQLRRLMGIGSEMGLLRHIASFL